MTKFRIGDRVQIREDHVLDVDPGVDHGDAATVVGLGPPERVYEVRFDGFEETEVVEESGLDPVKDK